MWVDENTLRPAVAPSRSVKRVMYALLVDNEGIVAGVAVPEHGSVSGTFYCGNVLPALLGHYLKEPKV